tara:strand:+ start:160 stop:684 length:525 start_codon:yes stop_codon:yes gene_type:complete
MKEKLENLNKELNLIFKKLSKYSSEEINFKPSLKKWSIGENMYHLWLTEITTENYIRKKTSYPETLINVSKIARLRLKLLKLIFFVGLKFKAPKIVVDPIPLNIDLKELKTKWLKSRDSFEILINNLDTEILKKGVLRHPLAGRIDMDMTLNFLLSHFRHHMKIIHKLEKKISL